MGSHWVVSIVVMIAYIVTFGAAGAFIGIPTALIAIEMGALGSEGDAWAGVYVLVFVSMLVFGCIGAVLGGSVGYKNIRSKDK